MRILVIPIALVLVGCSATEEETPSNVVAMQDYVAVAELAEVKRFRAPHQSTALEKLDNNPRYVLMKPRRKIYLVEFTRDCWELFGGQRVTPDYRPEGDYLRPGRDTIRGCRIGRAFEIDQAQAEEIRDIGDAPTGG